MTKRRLESDVAELSEEVLGDLTPAERLKVALTASATGKADWVTQLSETCPRARYDQPEQAFTVRKRFAFTLAQQAVYDLRTTALVFSGVETRDRANMVLAFFTDLDPVEYGFESVSRETPARLFRELYVHYEGYTRFADETLSVDLEEWLALHPDGRATVAMAETMLEEEADLRDFAEAGLADGTDEEVSLDDFADELVDQLQHQWREIDEKTT